MKISTLFLASALARTAEKLAQEEENLQLMVDNLLSLADEGFIQSSYADKAITAISAEEMTSDGFRLQSGRISFSSLSFAIAEVKRVNLEAMISVVVGKENMPKVEWSPDDRETAQVQILTT